MGGGKCFSLRFSTDAIVLLAHWVREGVYCYAVDTFRDWSCLLSLEEFSQLPLKSAQCGFGSQSPQENLRSLTRPEVEVKFSSTMI